MKHRSRTRSEYIASLEWNIRDAKEALRNAVDMGAWSNVVKYARQLEALEMKLSKATTASPRRERIAEAMRQENYRRADTESPADRRRRLESRGWRFGFARDQRRRRRRA